MNNHRAESPPAGCRCRFDLSFLLLLFPLLGILLFSFIQTTFAQQPNRWLYVASDTKDVRHYLDLETPERSGDKRRVWSKSVYPDGSSRITRAEWWCGRRKYFAFEERVYASDGSLLDSLDQGNLRSVVPDSISEGIYNAVCPQSAENAVPKAVAAAARVIVEKANIRESPTTGSPVTATAARGERFLLAADEPEGGWYRVFISDTKGAGWIHGSTIKLIEAAEQETATPTKPPAPRRRAN